tara:strand:- start:92 stop:316 length:225 start_codon:yes stop_codon:yes gene_type:complete
LHCFAGVIACWIQYPIGPLIERFHAKPAAKKDPLARPEVVDLGCLLPWDEPPLLKIRKPLMLDQDQSFASYGSR